MQQSNYIDDRKYKCLTIFLIQRMPKNVFFRKKDRQKNSEAVDRETERKKEKMF